MRSEGPRRPTSFIVFVSDLPPVEEIVGGEQVRPHEIVRWLERSGRRARVWCVRPRVSRRRNIGAVRVRSLTPHWAGMARELLAYPAALVMFAVSVLEARLAGCTPVLWHRAPGGVSWKWRLPVFGDPGWMCIELARLLRVPVWASNHDISPDHEQDKLDQLERAGAGTPSRARGQQRSARVNAALQRYSVRRSTMVSAVSEGTRNELIARYGLDPDRVTIVRAGVDPDAMEGIADWRPPEGVWRVGFLGSFADADTRLLLDTITCLADDPRVSFVLAGRGFERLDRSRLPPQATIEILPAVKYAEFADLANQVDIWLVPLATHGYGRWAWPLRMPMYLASGRPVVITDHPELAPAGVADLVWTAEAETGLSMADQILHVVADSRAAQGRAEEASRHALRQMAWDAQFGPTFTEILPR